MNEFVDIISIDARRLDFRIADCADDVVTLRLRPAGYHNVAENVCVFATLWAATVATPPAPIMSTLPILLIACC